VSAQFSITNTIDIQWTNLMTQTFPTVKGNIIPKGIVNAEKNVHLKNDLEKGAWEGD